MGYPYKKKYPGAFTETLTITVVLVFIFYVVLPFFWGPGYPDLKDLYSLISEIIGGVL